LPHFPIMSWKSSNQIPICHRPNLDRNQIIINSLAKWRWKPLLTKRERESDQIDTSIPHYLWLLTVFMTDSEIYLDFTILCSHENVTIPYCQTQWLTILVTQCFNEFIISKIVNLIKRRQTSIFSSNQNYCHSNPFLIDLWKVSLQSIWNEYTNSFIFRPRNK
jgi:hypothetical protein